jgi:hypothetical protein
MTSYLSISGKRIAEVIDVRMPSKTLAAMEAARRFEQQTEAKRIERHGWRGALKRGRFFKQNRKA